MAEGTAGTIPNRNAIHIHKRSRLQPPCATARSFTNKVYQTLRGVQGAGSTHFSWPSTSILIKTGAFTAII